MRETDFLHQFLSLLNANVLDMNLEDKTNLIHAITHAAQQSPDNHLPTCHIIPFVTGRRPIDEAAHPGLGSSDNTSMICTFPDPETNKTYILFELPGIEQYSAEECESLALDVTLSFAGTDNTQEVRPIPGWEHRPLQPMIFEKGAGGKPVLRTIALREVGEHNLVLPLSPERDLLPLAWAWEGLDAPIRDAATDGADPFTFGHMFTQILHVAIRLTHHGVPVATSQATVDVCDTRRFGSLYQRIVERLLIPDAARQGQKAGVQNLDVSFHPWFPVLKIGSDKAALYTDALVEDIVHKKRHLTDPQWLMRVGLYLEFLTCIGVFEAVKDDVGDLLTPAERAVYEAHPFFAEIRARLNPRGWRKVWELREISFPKFGVPQTGPVSALNLLQKKKATLAFLHVHHDDLKHAIDLAGRNEYNAQETWHRVFRDAERAVLRKTSDAFPELDYLDKTLREVILWHQKGRTALTGTALKQVTTLVGDQDGLFASACNQYRASMNEVAEWAKHRSLMDYTGQECVPLQVSLLQAYMDKSPDQVERLQRRDGYSGSLETIVKLPEEFKSPAEDVYDLLSVVPLFQLLTEAERRQLAQTAREIALGPMERIIIQGRAGSSLFLVATGQLEVLVRQSDGVDKKIDVKNRGDMVGEISLLTGATRTATVRALESAIVYEIGKRQYKPIIENRPELIDQLAAIMERNLQKIHEQREAYIIEKEASALKGRIQKFFFGK
ncbi:MAG: cyclic nucleotide-binding domain-containing protein [Anaerolineales bacterium]|nr:cyclic nucleotide-binding domain-containing protein [Anaerolineales bacterium]